MASAEDGGALAQRIAKCADGLVAFSGTVYRATPPKYANIRDLLSGVGSGHGGGRWNPPGVKAAYLALELETALAELHRAARRFGFDVGQLLPRTVCAIRVRLRRLLDLTSGRIRQRLRYSFADMVADEWWMAPSAGREATTQLLGRTACACGYEGLIAPSAAAGPGGRILVVFPDNLRRRSELEIVNADRLVDPQSGSPDV